MPLIARTVAEWTLIPIGVLMMLIMFALVHHRALTNAEADAASAFAL